MLTVAIPFLIGIIVGSRLTSNNQVKRLNDKFTLAALIALVLFMGVSLGATTKGNGILSSLGWKAIFLSLSSIIASTTAVWLMCYIKGDIK